jgi:hypothetical protein
MIRALRKLKFRACLGLVSLCLLGLTVAGPDTTVDALSDRTYEGKISLTEVVDDAAVLLDPMSVASTSSDAFYVLDFGVPVVKKFTPSGEQTNAFGNGSGSGPGEFENPTDFDVAPDGEIYVSDPVNGRVSHFAPDGSHIGDYRTESHPAQSETRAR